MTLQDILAMNNIFSTKQRKLVSYGRPKIYNLSGSRFRPECGGLVHFSEYRLSTKKQADQSTSTKRDQRSRHNNKQQKENTHHQTVIRKFEMTLEMASGHVHTRLKYLLLFT